jgi:hypothetical protein
MLILHFGRTYGPDTSRQRHGRVLINAQIAAGYALTLRLRHLWYLVLVLLAHACPKNSG